MRNRILAAVRDGVRGAQCAGVADVGRGADESTGASSAPAHHALLTRQLRTLADELLAQAKSGPPTRETAMTLLAADALITLACEVTAETDPDGLSEVR